MVGTLLARCLSLGRLGKKPKAQTAGRFVPPASVQRSQLGVQAVDLPSGVVTVRGGEVRCLLRLSGFPLHRAGPQEAAAFLAGFGRALNALPQGAAWIVRSRPGGLHRHITQQQARQRSTTPGTALAKLVGSQLAHAVEQARSGATRETTNYVALRQPKGDVRTLLTNALAATTQLKAIGLRVELVTNQALADALAVGWNPAHGEQQFVTVGADTTDETTLLYSPASGARIRKGPKA